MITTITANCGALKCSVFFLLLTWYLKKKKNAESLEWASRGMTCFLKKRCSPHGRILASLTKLIFASLFLRRHIRLRTHYLAGNVKGIFPSLNCAETLPPCRRSPSEVQLTAFVPQLQTQRRLPPRALGPAVEIIASLVCGAQVRHKCKL